MSRVLSFATLAALGLILSPAIYGQARERSGQGSRQDQQTGGNVLRASKVIGDNVKNTKGEDLGKIEDVVIDPQSGQIGYAVLSFGGFLGIGDKYFAIPWSALKQKDDDTFILEVEKDQLKAAPGFDKNAWPNMADRHWAAEIHRFYGTQPYWESGQGGGSQGGFSQSGAEGAAEYGRIERESVQLPLKFEKGKTYTYTFRMGQGGSSGGQEQYKSQSDRERQQQSQGQESQSQGQGQQSQQSRFGQSGSQGSQSQGKELKIQVVEASQGGESKLNVTYDPSCFEQHGSSGSSSGSSTQERSSGSTSAQSGQSGQQKMVSVTVDAEGRVKELKEAQGGSQGGQEKQGQGGQDESQQKSQSSQSTGGSSGTVAHEEQLKACLNCLFAAGLHREKLEVGKTYSLASTGSSGSSSSLQQSSSSQQGTESRSSSQQGTEGRSSSTYQSQSGGQGGLQHLAMMKFRFDGKAEKSGQELALFSLQHGMGGHAQGSTQERSGQERSSTQDRSSQDRSSQDRSSTQNDTTREGGQSGQGGQSSQGSRGHASSGGQQMTGVAAFRTNDGLLEKLNVQGPMGPKFTIERKE